MARLGLQGPFVLDANIIDDHFPGTAPGNYALGWVRKGKWSFDYVGRDDKDLNRRLKEHMKKAEGRSALSHCIYRN
jgi:hypothetical protein